MSLLLPIAGTAALSLARETVGAIGNGLSFATELLRQDNAPAPATQTTDAPPPIELRPSAAKEKFQQALHDFVARLRQRLASVGIEAGSLELESDGLGGVQVGGDRADRSAIEQVLSADEGLLAEFNTLAQQHQSLESGGDWRGDFGLLIAGDEAEAVWR